MRSAVHYDNRGGFAASFISMGFMGLCLEQLLPAPLSRSMWCFIMKETIYRRRLVGEIASAGDGATTAGKLARCTSTRRPATTRATTNRNSTYTFVRPRV